MSAPPPFAGSPLLRALLRALIFAAVIETIFHRLLTIPARSNASPWLADLHASTGRAGDLMASVAFALLLLTLLGIAWAALRAPAWPGGTNPLAAMGILVLISLLVLASLAPRGPAFALAFAGVSLLAGLGMLAGMFETREDLAGRCFAVALAGALVCMSMATVSEWLRLLSLPSTSPALGDAATAAGRWLLFAAGIFSFPAFAPPMRPLAGFVERAATFGMSAATAFTLVVGTVIHPPLLARLSTAFGGSASGAPRRILTTGTAAAALFLVTFTSLRGLSDPARRVRAFGLLFLVLAGYPHHTAYQHLLALLGLALVTASRQATITPQGVFPARFEGAHGLEGTSPPDA